MLATKPFVTGVAVRTWALWAATFLFLGGATGCHDEVTIKGTITIPVDVQRLFSMSTPGSVEVNLSEVPGVAFLPYLCEPTTQPLTLPYSFVHYGCATEQRVDVSAFRAKSPYLENVKCGEASKGSGGLRGEEVASATAVVFLGQSGCESGEATVDLALVAK